MLNRNSSAGTAADSRKQPIVSTSADIEANPMLAAGCYPKSLSKGTIRIIAIANVNGYEIVNEFIPNCYNEWYLLNGNKQVSVKKTNGKFSHFPTFKKRDEAESYANSLPSACR